MRDGASLFHCCLACICDLVHRLCAENFSACEPRDWWDRGQLAEEKRRWRDRGIASST
jgi:hypothetical protein